MSISLKKHEQMLFALLRASLQQTEVDGSLFQNATNADWKACYKLSAVQGVMAIAWDAVAKLPAEQMPPVAVRLSWATAVEHYEKQYSRYCAVAGELSAVFAEHGISTVLLKGIGLSTLYPVPSHREGGDIDIYTCSADKSKMSDAEANELANQLIMQAGISVKFDHYKHSEFVYKGVPVENHKHFVNVKVYKVAERAEEILHRLIKPRFAQLDKSNILVPSPEFNSLFVVFHAAQHYGCGMSLHHLCDWAVILNLYGLNIPADFDDKRFIKAMNSLTLICNKYMGTSVQVDGNEQLMDEILDSILNPKFSAHIESDSRFGILLYKTRRMLYGHKLTRRFFKTSLLKRVCSSIIYHLLKPGLIFAK
jgi:hypothetical protein